MKIAIYEPDPRICGPATWAAHLKRGFMALGHECDVVTFNKSGKVLPKYGRIEQFKGSSMSCKLVPSYVFKRERDEEVLDSYDLIVLTDVKCASHDNAALEACEPWPDYIDVLMQTKTPWTSALHGSWYFEESEAPKGVAFKSGSPFIGELLALPNFSGFLIAHAKDFDRYSTGLQAIKDKPVVPLPYILQVPAERVEQERSQRKVACIGRMVPTKHRQVLNCALIRGWPVDMIYAGATTCTHGPSVSFELWEHLTQNGFEGVRDVEGTRRNSGWRCSKSPAFCEYRGSYTNPIDALYDVSVHVGITHADFSGGLLEFSTIEAIDCGCIPVVGRRFVPDVHGDQYIMQSVRDLYGMSALALSRHPEGALILHEIESAVASASFIRSVQTVRHNRETVAKFHDPSIHAKLFIEGAL